MNISLTKNELRTLIWMAQNQYATSVKYCVERGEDPATNDTIQRILTLSKKASKALTPPAEPRKTSPRYTYIVGDEHSNVLGSGSDIDEILRTRNEEEAFKAFAEMRCNWMCREWIQDGKLKRMYWNHFLSCWEE